MIIHHLIVQDGMDESVMDAIKNKSNMQNALMNALKARIEKLNKRKY